LACAWSEDSSNHWNFKETGNFGVLLRYAGIRQIHDMQRWRFVGEGGCFLRLSHQQACGAFGGSAGVQDVNAAMAMAFDMGVRYFKQDHAFVLNNVSSGQ
jgi:hypothetical protein